MKNSYTLLFSLLVFAATAYSQDAPGTKKSFVPDNWKLIRETYGDLNKDSVNDAALVLEYAGEALEGERPRALLILFKNKTGPLYTKACRADHAILDGQSGGTMGDPFESMSIKKNVLIINFSGGSRQKWTTTHRYRLQDNSYFRLIGATYKVEYLGVTTTYDYNLSNGNVIVTTKDPKNKANNKVVNTVHKLRPVGLDDFEPDAVWAILMPKDYATISTCAFQEADFGDCYHLQFECGDFGNAQTYLDEAAQNIWQELSATNGDDETVANPKYAGKTFEITYLQKTGIRCEAQGEDMYQLVVGFKLKN